MSVVVQKKRAKSFDILRTKNVQEVHLGYNYAAEQNSDQGYVLAEADGLWVVKDSSGNGRLPGASLATAASANPSFAGREAAGEAVLLWTNTKRNDVLESGKLTCYEGKFPAEIHISRFKGTPAVGNYLGVVASDDADSGKLEAFGANPFGAVGGATATESVAVYGKVEAVDGEWVRVDIYGEPRIANVDGSAP